VSRASNRFWPLGEPLVPPHVDVNPPGQGGESPPGLLRPPDPDYGIEVTPPPDPPAAAPSRYPRLFADKLAVHSAPQPVARLQSLTRDEIKQLYVRHPKRNFAFNQHVTFKR